jgi:hypothetical protein
MNPSSWFHCVWFQFSKLEVFAALSDLHMQVLFTSEL